MSHSIFICGITRHQILDKVIGIFHVIFQCSDLGHCTWTKHTFRYEACISFPFHLENVIGLRAKEQIETTREKKILSFGIGMLK